MELEAVRGAADAGAVAAQEWIERLEGERPGRRELLVRNHSDFATPWCALALLDAAEDRRFEIPSVALEWAMLARASAARVSGPIGADCRAESAALAANALRQAGRFGDAERRILEAREALEQGSGDVLVHARVSSLEASLALTREQHDRARRLLRESADLYLASGDDEAAAGTLVKVALLFAETDQAAAGLELLECASRLLPADADARLRLSVIHNGLWLTLLAGDAETAFRSLLEALPVYRLHGGRWAAPVWRWLMAQVLTELGRSENAAPLYRMSVDELVSEDRIPAAAHAGLAEARTLVEVGELEEALEPAQAVAGVFRSLGLEREEIAAVLVEGEALRLSTVRRLARQVVERRER